MSISRIVGLKRIINSRNCKKKKNNNSNNNNNKSFFPYYLLVIAGMSLVSYKLSYQEVMHQNKVVYEETLDANQENFSELFDDYNSYVEIIAKGIKECNEERNILKDYAIYSAMLNNGYCTLGTNFESQTPNIEVHGLMGANIAIGEGVCRNASIHLRDVFSALGYDTNLVIGKSYSSKKSKTDYENHAVVYVSDGNEYFLLDPINKTIWLRSGHLKYNTINSQEDDYFYFKASDKYVDPIFGEVKNTQLTWDFDVKNYYFRHWKILKQYREYEKAAEEYLEFFQEYENEYLEPVERDIQIGLFSAYLQKKLVD